jgi:hypothetical protein
MHNKIHKKKHKNDTRRLIQERKSCHSLLSLTFPRKILSLGGRSLSSEAGIAAMQFFHPPPVLCSAIPLLCSVGPLPLPLLNVVFLTFSALLPMVQVIMRENEK